MTASHICIYLIRFYYYTHLSLLYNIVHSIHVSRATQDRVLINEVVARVYKESTTLTGERLLLGELIRTKCFVNTECSRNTPTYTS